MAATHGFTRTMAHFGGAPLYFPVSNPGWRLQMVHMFFPIVGASASGPRASLRHRFSAPWQCRFATPIASFQTIDDLQRILPAAQRTRRCFPSSGLALPAERRRNIRVFHLAIHRAADPRARVPWRWGQRAADHRRVMNPDSAAVAGRSRGYLCRWRRSLPGISCYGASADRSARFRGGSGDSAPGSALGEPGAGAADLRLDPAQTLATSSPHFIRRGRPAIFPPHRPSILGAALVIDCNHGIIICGTIFQHFAQTMITAPPPQPRRSPRKPDHPCRSRGWFRADEHQFGDLGTEDQDISGAVVSPQYETIWLASSGYTPTRAFPDGADVRGRASKTTLCSEPIMA